MLSYTSDFSQRAISARIQEGFLSNVNLISIKCILHRAVLMHSLFFKTIFVSVMVESFTLHIHDVTIQIREGGIIDFAYIHTDTVTKHI